MTGAIKSPPPFWTGQEQNRKTMLGTILNGVGILAGGLIGRYPRWQIPAPKQAYIKYGLGAFTIFFSFKLIYQALSQYELGRAIKLFGVAFLGMVLGRLMGRFIGIQKGSNRLGNYARIRMETAIKSGSKNFNDAFVAGSLLFCVTPLAFLGALQDGLQGFFWLLAIKAAMDCLATMSFVTIMGRGILLSALPVVAWQGLLTLAAQWLQQKLALQPDVLAVIHVTTGLIAMAVFLIIMDVKKVELADYLPSLAVAPALAWLFFS